MLAYICGLKVRCKAGRGLEIDPRGRGSRQEIEKDTFRGNELSYLL